ncbi:MAG: hypothetical protein JWM21_850 [Acidobacteria bacterium]|nr:hypothetical protein [Acidobacteriota bacterium]
MRRHDAGLQEGGSVFDGLLEVLEFDVSVDLRGVQGAVAEQLLDVTDAGAATQEMSGARVAEGVHRGSEFRLQSMVADALGDHLIRETTAGDWQPQSRSWWNEFRLATSLTFAPPLAGSQLRTRAVT